MKTIKCQHCEETFQAETREEILDVLYAHYITSHAEVIPDSSAEEKQAWMVRFEKEWASAESV